MQNEQNTNIIRILKDTSFRIKQWKQIKFIQNMVHLIRQCPSEHSPEIIRYLNDLFKDIKISIVNPYKYWIERQLTLNTNGIKFNTKWY